MTTPPHKGRRRKRGDAHKGAPSAQGKTHKSALVLVPPKHLWEPVQAIRRDHDPQYARWMPHITLLYPFRPREAWADGLPALECALAQVAPFELRLSEVRVFRHGPSRFTVWLVPEPAAPLAHLHQVLWRAAPECDDVSRHAGGYTPHLTLAQLSRRQAVDTLLTRLRTEWEALHFTVDSVSLVWRDEPPDDRFRVDRLLSLGPALGERPTSPDRLQTRPGRKS